MNWLFGRTNDDSGTVLFQSPAQSHMPEAAGNKLTDLRRCRRLRINSRR